MKTKWPKMFANSVASTEAPTSTSNAAWLWWRESHEPTNPKVVEAAFDLVVMMMIENFETNKMKTKRKMDEMGSKKMQQQNHFRVEH